MNLNSETFFKWIVLQSLASDYLETISKDMHRLYYEQNEAKLNALEQQIIKETMHDVKLQTKRLKAFQNVKTITHTKEKKELNDFIIKCRKFSSVFNYSESAEAKKYLDLYIQKNIIVK